MYECVKYMTGHSHTDNGEGKEFGLQVMQKMNDKCKEWKEKENMDYSVYGTPIESTTYKFAKCLKERFIMRDNIILTGFMGSGKTSVGIRLSYSLRRTMIDTDKWIEKKQGMTVSEIFAEEGEEAFRNMETKCLQELLKTTDHQIISVGGGLPVREENRQLLSRLGRVFYLKASPETIYE